MHTNTKRLTRLSLLTSVALIIFIVEAQLPSLTTVPGVKMGLSNIVTLTALYLYRPLDALSVLIIRIVLGSIFSGQMTTLFFSLGGGLVCFAVCVLLRRLFPLRRFWQLSMIGAVFHNLGQIAVAILVTSTPEILWYLPVLLLSGLISGCFTGLCAKYLLQHLCKLEKNPTNQNRW